MLDKMIQANNDCDSFELLKLWEDDISNENILNNYSSLYPFEKSFDELDFKGGLFYFEEYTKVKLNIFFQQVKLAEVQRKNNWDNSNDITKKLNRDIVFLKEKHNEDLYFSDSEYFNGIGKQIFKHLRQKLNIDCGWYAVDIEVDKFFRIEVIVFDMLDNMHGGIGQEQFRFTYNYKDDNVVIPLIHEAIEGVKTQVAERLYKAKKHQKKLKKIEKMRKKLFDK